MIDTTQPNEYDISIIIPFLNEEENIPVLITELEKFILSRPEIKFEVVFVDDGSTDSSVSKLKSIKNVQAKLVTLSKNYGSHAALRAGVFYSSGKNIVNIYADLQEPLEMIPVFYEKIKEGNDVVWGFREDSDIPFNSKVFSKVFAWLMKKYVNEKYTDKGLDFLMFNHKVKKELNNNIEANSSFVLQILNFGFRQAYIPYMKEKRRAGKSKWGFSKKIKIFIDSFIAFSYAPIRFVTFIGISFFVLGLVWSGYLIFRKIFSGDLVSGWPTLMSILLLGFGITNISLGIIAEYLWRTLDVSRKRPVFIIEDITTL